MLHVVLNPNSNNLYHPGDLTFFNFECVSDGSLLNLL